MKWLVLSAALFLSACTNGGFLGADSLTKDKADSIITAEGWAQRGLRACLATTVISELMTYRLVWFESTNAERADARTAIDEMLKAVQTVRSAPEAQDPFWFETEMFYVIVGLVHGLEGTIKDSVLGTVKDALIGDLDGLVGTLRVRAGQAALAKVMIDDVKRYFEREDRGTSEWLNNGWDLCEARARANITKLE